MRMIWKSRLFYEEDRLKEYSRKLRGTKVPLYLCEKGY